MMKKIIAGAVAAILAVSTLATAAFAADTTIDLAGSTPVYNATVKYDINGTITSHATDATLQSIVSEIGSDETNLVASDANLTITSTKIDIQYVNNAETPTIKTFSATSAAATPTTVSFKACAMAALGADIYDATTGAPFAGTVTITVTSDKKFTAGDVSTLVAIASGATETNGKLTVDADTATPSLNAGALTVKDADMKTIAANGKDVTLTVTQKEKFDDTTLTKLTYTAAGATDATIVPVLAAKDATSVTFTIPAAAFFKAATLTDGEVVAAGKITTLKVEGLTSDITAATLTVAGAEEEETTTVAEEEETTTEVPAADETTEAEAEATTAADGAADGKGDNTNTGVALAVIPAIIAGAAVVVSRKRK